MARADDPSRILLVTGLSGAGKTTVLKTLEDLGWEVVDNLPLSLVRHLLATPLPAGADRTRPLAIGLDSRTRGFDAEGVVKQIKRLAREHAAGVEMLYLECQTPELLRRYSETRRRHPLAPDRPATDGILEERELTAPLKRWADHVIDTTDSDSNLLRQQVRDRFGGEDAPTLTVISFGFSRGVPRNADLVFDMRFLRNPHWHKPLRELTGLDRKVAQHIAEDEVYEDALERIEGLLLTLLPRYRAEGKSYVSVAFGCTGGRHRSVHVAERVAGRLRAAGFSPTVAHRDLATPPRDGIERSAGAESAGTGSTTNGADDEFQGE
ncbi:RNase adapter RapZ [Sphingosinicella terrae]|uniref:RNase adapter RapZ n=1 Tax=Sphingosinicella terrae TaxID=2172047 RepID=UPI0025475A1C|nr:RNase adapter RapZ [Sphingosinicella terrae]